MSKMDLKLKPSRIMSPHRIYYCTKCKEEVSWSETESFMCPCCMRSGLRHKGGCQGTVIEKDPFEFPIFHFPRKTHVAVKCSECLNQYRCDQDDTMIRPNCFKKISKDFIYDKKHKEWIDTRCNNPKLKKLSKESVPALLTTPFDSVEFDTLKNEMRKDIKVFALKKGIPWERYSHIPILTTNARVKRSLLGKRLFWTIKEDGENVTIWLRKKKYTKNSSSLYTGLVDFPKGFEIIVSSHNQEIASADITARTQSCPEYQKILKLIRDNPSYRVVAEECKKGNSITNIKVYPEAILYVVDIYDTAIKNFLPYTLVYQTCYHYHIPVVTLFAETRHRTIRDLNAYCHHILEHCEAVKEEGMVLKTFTDDNEYIQAKVKLDIPEPQERKVHEGQIKLPQIPESEIMGAISHVEADFGLTGKPKDDMPRIAKAVSEECRKHLYSSRGNLFIYYQKFMEKRK